jgi:hypothetical protein
MKSILIGIAIAVLGCSKDKAPAAAGNDCESAIGKGVDQTIAKRRGSAAPSVDAVAAQVPMRLKTTLVKLCTEDKWSSEVLDCFRTTEDIKACKEKLTPAQRQRYSAEIVQVMLGGRPRPEMMPPAGHDTAPPTGSAPAPAGSAAPAP